MNKITLSSILVILIIFLIACEQDYDTFSFVVAADMRYKAKEEFRNSHYFLGACEAIKKYGKGAFMISPGDIDPPSAVREVISQVLGGDYPWYPVVGNHDIESIAFIEYLRNYNLGGTSLPNIVNSGPPGCVETTYSFDWGDNHFVVLNQYYDGQSDMGTDGDHVPELLSWLEEDLVNNKKKYTFVFGHEPLIAMPDMDNGRLRHQDDSLNKYPKSNFQFHQMLKKFQVTAYFCGHSHNASMAKINGIWQIDAGHARGIEDIFPTMILEELSAMIIEGRNNGIGKNESITAYFKEHTYSIKKILYYSDLTNGIHYRQLDDESALTTFHIFYKQFSESDQLRQQYQTVFWENANLTRSTFLKMKTNKEKVTIEIYRDDARGGEYSLMHTEILN